MFGRTPLPALLMPCMMLLAHASPKTPAIFAQKTYRPSAFFRRFRSSCSHASSSLFTPAVMRNRRLRLPYTRSMVMDSGFIDQSRTDPSPSQSARVDTDEKKPRVLFVLGGPGSGKGTQCKIMADSFSLHHLSAGDLLRAERDREGSKVGELINNYITEGQIVPVEITVSLLKGAMEQRIKDSVDSDSMFLIDGFPRSHENLRGWGSVIGDWADVVGVIFLDCPEDEMEKRILKRAETEGRNDDNLHTIKKRFHTYVADTMPVIEHYRNENKLFTIPADGDRDSVASAIESLVTRLFNDAAHKTNA